MDKLFWIKVVWCFLGYSVGVVTMIVVLALCKAAGKCIYQNDDGTCEKDGSRIL